MCRSSLRLTATTLLQSSRPSTSIQVNAAMKKRWSRAATSVHATYQDANTGMQTDICYRPATWMLAECLAAALLNVAAAHWLVRACMCVHIGSAVAVAQVLSALLTWSFPLININTLMEAIFLYPC